MKEVEKNLDKIAGVELIKDKITKSRRILKKDNPDLNKILSLLTEAKNMYNSEIKWRNRAKLELLPQLEEFDNSIKDTIGLRLQERLTEVEEDNKKLAHQVEDLKLNGVRKAGL